MTDQRTGALRWLNIALSDPALIPGLRADCPALDALLSQIPAEEAQVIRPVGFPALSTLTAMQVGVFDNTTHYAVTIELWDSGQASLKTRRNTFNVKLYDFKRFKRNLKKSRAAGLSAEWKEGMAAMLEHGEDYLYGPVTSTQGGGYRYLEGQFIVVKIVNGVPDEAIIFANGDFARVEADWFDDRSHMGKRLHKNIVGSARIDFTGDSLPRHWSTKCKNPSTTANSEPLPPPPPNTR